MKPTKNGRASAAAPRKNHAEYGTRSIGVARGNKITAYLGEAAAVAVLIAALQQKSVHACHDRAVVV